jgi:hypothetical protein
MQDITSAFCHGSCSVSNEGDICNFLDLRRPRPDIWKLWFLPYEEVEYILSCEILWSHGSVACDAI